MEAEEEGAKKLSEVNFENLPPNYHNESNMETRIGNKTVQTHQEIDKVWENIEQAAGSYITFSSEVTTLHILGRNKITWSINFPDDNTLGFYYNLFACLITV